jgi:hypothetical protein
LKVLKQSEGGIVGVQAEDNMIQHLRFTACLLQNLRFNITVKEVK